MCVRSCVRVCVLKPKINVIFSMSEMYLCGRTSVHGAIGRRIDPLNGGPIKLFLVPAKTVVYTILSVEWCM